MEFIDDRVRRMHIRGDMIDCLMANGVKRLADRRDRRHALRAEKIEQGAHGHLDTVEDGLGIGAFASRRQRALEIVDYRQQVAEDTLALNPHRLLALLANPLPSIFGLSKSPQILILKLGNFLLFLSDLRLQRIRITDLRRLLPVMPRLNATVLMGRLVLARTSVVRMFVRMLMLLVHFMKPHRA